MIPLKLTRAHSPTKDTGRVFGWLVAEGDEVRNGQPVVEIELGRVTMELEAPGNGVIHLLVERGATVAVGGALAEIRSPAEVAAAAPQAARPTAEAEELATEAPADEAEADDPVAREADEESPPEPEAPAAPEPEPAPVAAEAPAAAADVPLATPAARRLADQVGIDLAEVAGTGPDGRILAEDVEKLVASRPATQLISSIETQESAATPPEPTAAVPEPTAAEPEPLAAAPPEPDPEQPEPEPEPEPAAAEPSAPAAETPPAPPPSAPPAPPGPPATEVPSPPSPPESEPEAERAAEPAAASVVAAPPAAAGHHIHLGGELAADGLVEAHRTASRQFEGRTTVTDLLIMVVARALTEVPELNGTIAGDGAIQRSAAVHVALADASEDADQAPVLHNAPSLELEEIAKERTRLAEAAQKKQLAEDDLAGATCTFSNLGGYPLDFYVPSGAGAQIALVTTGRVMEKPISFQRMLTIRPRMWVSVALDGRGADPETGGRFLAALQRRLNELPSAIS